MIKQIAKFLFHNWRPKLISIFVASGLWFYTQTQKYSEITVTIPIIYQKRPKALSFQTEPKRFLKIKIRGLRENLKFPTSQLRAKVDLSHASSMHRKYAISFDENQLPERVEVLNIPDTLNLRLEENAQKLVRVRYKVTGKPASGFIRGRTTVRPEKIKIRGPKTAVKAIRYVDAEEVQIQGYNKSFSKSVKLVLKDGVKALGGSKVIVRVSIFAENTINEKLISTVSLQAMNLDPALVALLSDKVVKIQIGGDSNALKKVSAKDFQATIDLEGTSYNPETGNILPFDTESGIPVSIRVLKFKNNINVINVVPENVTVRFQVKPSFKKEKPPEPEVVRPGANDDSEKDK